MSEFFIRPGMCFWGALGENGTEHLHIILANVPGSQPLLCAVSVSSNNTKNSRMFDDSCILNAGDHPAIHHSSFVVYAKTHAVSPAVLQDLLHRRRLRQSAALDLSVFHRVLEGALKSRRIREIYKGPVLAESERVAQQLGHD